MPRQYGTVGFPQAAVAPPVAFSGNTYYDTAKDQAYVVNVGGAWVPINNGDTGWVNLTPASGTGTCRYRVRGGIVYFQCALTGMTAVAVNATGSVVAVGGIPVAYRPLVTIYSAGSATGSGMTLGVINTDGSISQWNPTYNAGTVTVARFAMSWPME